MLILVYIAKANSKPCEKCEMELFPKIVTGYKGNSESCHTSKKEHFAKIVKN